VVIGKEANCHVLFIVHILDPEDDASIIEGTNAEFEIVDVADCVPLVPFLEVNFRRLDSGIGTEMIALNE
jgi:hypothetical protein